MSTSDAVYHSPRRPQPRRRSRLLVVSVVAGLAVAAVLVAHGAAWWSAPLVVIAAVVVAHLAVVVGLVVLAAVMTRAAGEGGPRGDLIHRPRLYDWFVRILSGGREARLRAAWLDLAALRPGESILDVGCGTGTLLLAAAERVGPTGRLAGVEASPEMAARARDKASARGVALEVHTGSADALPHADASFDVAVSTLVFHHLPADVQQGALREIRRVLRPGGRFVLVDLPHEHGHGRGPGHGPRSLMERLHGGARARVVDVDAALRELGASEVTHHPTGMRALHAIRAVFA
ncbi:MAG: methyltransferase domain-containing protein [Nannocystaceae bacterium]